MSILNMNRNRKKLIRMGITAVLIGWLALLFITAFLPGNAMAGGVGDVVTKVTNSNLTSTEFNFGQESATGHNFAIHAGMGDYGNGGCMISVLGPVQPDEIQTLLDYVDSIVELTYIQTTRIKGCEVREYSTEYGVGVGVVLPDYFITVEMLDTGNSRTADFAVAKSIAQQTLDGMERAGLLSQAAPDIESGKPDEPKPAEKAPAAAGVVTANPLDEPTRIADTTNIMAVYNGPTVPTTLSINTPHLVTEIHDYHWNNAQGATPGTIGLQDQNGKMYGPWQAVGTPGQGGVPNANWFVYPNIVIPAGTYTVIDSDPSTWSQNTDSGGRGMGYVLATPHFEVTSGSVGDLNKGPGSSPAGSGWTESPAGVGSVGNIPGPSNTTEAVTGVVVPGLISIALGALAGFGGGGGTVPPGGVPLSPSGGGTSPVGGIPGTTPSSGAAQEIGQLGKRRREEIYIDTVDMQQQAIDVRDAGPVTDHGMIIDTAAMFEIPIAVRPESGIIIDTADEAAIFVQPEPEIHIDTIDMHEGVSLQPEPEIHIDTIDMHEGVSLQPESGIHIDTIDMHEGVSLPPEPEILIDTTEMFAGKMAQGAVPDKDIYIETEAEAGLFVQPEIDKQGIDIRETGPSGEPEFVVASSGEPGAAAQAESGVIIETADETAVIKPDSGIMKDESGGEVLFDASELEDKPPAGNEIAGADGEVAPGTETEASIAKEESVFDQEGFDKEGFDKDGFDKTGFDREGFNADGFDKDGFNREGFNAEGLDKAGFDKEGFNQAGFDKEGFNREGFDQAGYDREGFDKAGFDAEGFNKEGFDKAGFDKGGFDKSGFDREGFNQAGFDKEGFNREGFDQTGFNREGFNREGFDKAGFDKEGFNQAGFDKEGFNREGFDQTGFNREGFNREGFDKAGFDKEGYNREGFDQAGFDKEGFNQEGFDKAGFDKEGFDKAGFDKTGFDREGFNQAGFDKEGYNREGFNQAGFDQEGFNKEGFDKAGFDREGFNKAGFDKEGYDRQGFNKAGFDKEGYGRNGFDPEGFDREGYDVNGYDRKGYNRSGFDAKGYDKQGYDKEGFNKDGWDREGYNRKGFDENGWDREGYDKNGYDAEGYDRDGYNREGQSKEGYDADGYDKNGFNEHGYDRDGYDREGFDFEGYNRGGHDPWGFDRQGYGKDGYHWSGYNADGYDRSGLHWSENPYGEGSPFDVDTRNPFDGGIVDLGGRKEAWEPTKPPLGQPYHRTVEKYGTKPWTDEIPQPQPEKPTLPPTEDTGVIGPEDPMNTLKNHGLDKDAPATPEGQTGTGLPIPEEDIPDAGNIPPDTIPGEGDIPQEAIPDLPPVSGPQHGDTITLPGKDGRDYQLEYNSQTGEWENLLTGGKIRNEELDSYIKDFNRWQDDVAEDLSRSARDIEKMAARQDANSQAIDKNLADWKRLEQMQKVADKYNIGEPGGPGDIDKAIQNLKDDMLAGKEPDQGRLEQLNKIIDNRIQGITAADTGQRWEEDWFKNLGWALEANAATAKEVITGEKADGSTSWLGMGARIMITAATGGTAGVVMDGGLTVAEAMYRIKDSIDKGESDFRAVSKAIGLTVLGEEMGYLAGAAGGTIMGEMMERFPAFTNKAADLIETALLKASAKNQMWSKSLGFISKESAEESLDQINKRLVDIGSDEAAENIIKNARGGYGLSVADSFDDVAKGPGKAFTGGGDDIFKGTGKSASEGWSDIAEGGGKATSVSSGDLAKGGSKAASASSDDLADFPLNRGGRTPEGVMSDPAAVARAERTVQGNIKDFDKLPPARQQDLVREQAIYDEYKLQAEERTWNLADKVQRGEPLTVEDIMEMKSDPASMRTLKNLREMDGLGSQLTQQEAEGIQREFNNVMDEYVHQPSYHTVEDHLHNRYPGVDPEGIRVRTVRTPGTEPTDFNINTDNDVIAERLVRGPNGPEWVEIPKSEWEDTYYKALAENSGFSVDEASRRFPQTDWANMDEAAQVRQWARHHEESAMDQFDLSAGRDFSDQRTWRIEDGDLPGRPMIEATPEEIARGVDTVMIDGKPMRPSTGYELVQRRQGNLLDSEQLSLMESHKVDEYWTAGTTPSEVMRNQTEAMEQLRKTASVAQTVESSYRDMGYRIEQMPRNMQEAIKVINNNSLSPAARAARLQELGYETPGDFLNKVTSRIGAIRTARR